MGFPKDGDRFTSQVFPGIYVRLRAKHEKLLNGETRILLIQVEHNPIPENIRCKDCGSRNIYRHGFTASGVQR